MSDKASDINIEQKPTEDVVSFLSPDELALVNAPLEESEEDFERRIREEDDELIRERAKTAAIFSFEYWEGYYSPAFNAILSLRGLVSGENIPEKARIINTQSCQLILRNDPRIQLQFNEMLRTPEIREEGKWVALDKQHLGQLQLFMLTSYGVNITEAALLPCIVQTAKTLRRVYGMKEYLERVRWNPEQGSYLDRFFTDYMVAADQDKWKILPKYGRMLFISIVARILDPGCKVDSMFMLAGNQGIRKSSALEMLMPEKSYYGVVDFNQDRKDRLLAMRRIHIAEVQELTGFDRKSAEALKADITTATDLVRDPYGKNVHPVPRSSVYIGTTNAQKPLNNDNTGDRRFPCVRIEKVNIDLIKRDRSKLWAEAVWRYNEWCNTGAEENTWWIEKGTDEYYWMRQYQLSEFKFIQPWQFWASEILSVIPKHIHTSRLLLALKYAGVVKRTETFRTGFTQRVLPEWLRSNGWKKKQVKGIKVWIRETNNPELPTALVPEKNIEDCIKVLCADVSHATAVNIATTVAQIIRGEIITLTDKDYLNDGPELR